jgi:hypothetical protein
MTGLAIQPVLATEADSTAVVYGLDTVTRGASLAGCSVHFFVGCSSAESARARPHGFSTARTLPALPSTSRSWPSRNLRVAVPVPTTAGNPYSLATTAQWLSTPP